jgi:hypothetical protein
MSTCPPNLVYSFLTVCVIKTFKVDKKNKISLCQRKTAEF